MNYKNGIGRKQTNQPSKNVKSELTNLSKYKNKWLKLRVLSIREKYINSIFT